MNEYLAARLEWRQAEQEFANAYQALVREGRLWGAPRSLDVTSRAGYADAALAAMRSLE